MIKFIAFSLAFSVFAGVLARPAAAASCAETSALPQDFLMFLADDAKVKKSPSDMSTAELEGYYRLYVRVRIQEAAQASPSDSFKRQEILPRGFLAWEKRAKKDPQTISSVQLLRDYDAYRRQRMNNGVDRGQGSGSLALSGTSASQFDPKTAMGSLNLSAPPGVHPDLGLDAIGAHANMCVRGLDGTTQVAGQIFTRNFLGMGRTLGRFDKNAQERSGGQLVINGRKGKFSGSINIQSINMHYQDQSVNQYNQEAISLGLTPAGFNHPANQWRRTDWVTVSRENSVNSGPLAANNWRQGGIGYGISQNYQRILDKRVSGWKPLSGVHTIAESYGFGIDHSALDHSNGVDASADAVVRISPKIIADVSMTPRYVVNGLLPGQSRFQLNPHVIFRYNPKGAAPAPSSSPTASAQPTPSPAATPSSAPKAAGKRRARYKVTNVAHPKPPLFWQIQIRQADPAPSPKP